MVTDASCQPSPRSGNCLRFGPFELSVARRELQHSGTSVEIGQRGMDLLLTLLADPGRVISKRTLIRAAWGERVVEASNLSVQIAKLRQALAAGTGAEFIQTVQGSGYMFAGTVQREGSAEPPDRVQLRHTNSPREPLTAFIGRERERHELPFLLRSARIVTVAGIGGIGKTRLVLQLQQELAAGFADGALFVDLAPLAAPDQVAEALVAVLGAGASEGAAEATALGVLRGRHMLLIFDNAEHLAGATGQLITSVLAACPAVAAVVTSRESLGIPGETVLRLLPMSVPPAPGSLSAAEALGFDAVRLFADRASSLLPGFRMDDGNAGPVTEICRRLDGIALAIEMAVPRLEVLGVELLAERLRDRFATLPALRHNVPARQRTLRAMFDWSWDLLPRSQRRVLQLLAVSVGGTTLRPLEALAAADDGAAATPEVLDDLAALARKSLVAVTAPDSPGQDGPRYQLLETTRQYALGHLAPAAHTALNRLHAHQVAALFEEAEADWPALHGATWLGRYGPDADNLRAAIQWAFGTPGEIELALRLVAASVLLWWELPGLPLREARRWYARALAAIGPATQPGVQGRLWFGQSWLDTLDGDAENLPAATRAVALFRAAGDSIWLGAALWRAAGAALGRDQEPQMATLLTEAFRALDGQGAAKWQALCRVHQADRLTFEGALLPALAEYDHALHLARSLGYGYGLLVCGGNRSYLLFQLGRHREALDALHALDRELPEGLRQPVLSLLAINQAALGRDAEARAMVHRSLTGTPGIGLAATVARSIEALALLQAREGAVASAGQLLGFVLTRHDAARVRLGPRRAVYQALVAILEQSLGSDVMAAELSHGAGWSDAEALAAASKACGVAPW